MFFRFVGEREGAAALTYDVLRPECNHALHGASNARARERRWSTISLLW